MISKDRTCLHYQDIFRFLWTLNDGASWPFLQEEMDEISSGWLNLKYLQSLELFLSSSFNLPSSGIGFKIFQKIFKWFWTKMIFWLHSRWTTESIVRKWTDGPFAIFSISGSLFSLKYLESFPFWKALAPAVASKIYFSDSLDPPSVFREIPAISQSKICVIHLCPSVLQLQQKQSFL